MFFVAQNPPPPPIAAEVRIVQSPVQERLRITRPAEGARLAPQRIQIAAPPAIPQYRGRYLTPREQVVRRGKFAGGPPDVCNGSVCALSVWRQLGEMQLRDPFERP
jgi:hypothetical protein